MIDWLLSKLGLLIFVAGVLAALLSFFTVFSDSFSIQSAASAATDIARLMDSVPDGGHIDYSMPLKDYSLNVSGRIVSVNGVERGFASTASPAAISSAATLRIERTGGIMIVTGV